MSTGDCNLRRGVYATGFAQCECALTTRHRRDRDQDLFTSSEIKIQTLALGEREYPVVVVVDCLVGAGINEFAGLDDV